MKRISREAAVLMLIGMADLVLTIFLVRYRNAAEGNPLMAYYLHQGVTDFVIAKLILCAVPLFVLEYARRQRPRMVTACMRGLIAAYLGSYITGIVQMNDIPTQAKVRTVDLAWVESPDPQYTVIMAKLHRSEATTSH